MGSGTKPESPACLCVAQLSTVNDQLVQVSPMGAGDIPQLLAETAGNVALGWGKKEGEENEQHPAPGPT